MGFLEIPQRGYVRRMKGYLAEMYPPLHRLFAAILLCCSFSMLLARIHAVTWSPLSGYVLLGTGDIFVLFLILRLMDELKDEDLDRKLFSSRPLPAGRVHKTDITFSLVASIVIYAIINLFVWRVYWAPGLVLVYALCMFKYFFTPPRFQSNLLLNLGTHNPIIALLLLSLVVLFAKHHDWPLTMLKWGPIVGLTGLFWAMGLAWEISRKIRTLREENAYITYSKILGRTGAVLAACGAQTVTLLLSVYFVHLCSLSGSVLIIVGLGYAMLVIMYFNYLYLFSSSTSHFKSFAESYIFFVCAAFIIEEILS